MDSTDNYFNRLEREYDGEVKHITAPLENNYVVWITSNQVSTNEETNELEKSVHNGNGVLVGDLLITAGHVVKKGSDHTFRFNDHIFKLKDLEEIFISTAKENYEYDLAVYKISGINSPLTLSPKKPEINHILTSKSYSMGKGYIACDATVIDTSEESGLYYGVETSVSLKEGSSGSPLFDGNQVFGIIVAGNNDKNEKVNPELSLNTCYVLSSSAINEIINQIK